MASDDRLLQRYESNAEAANLAERLGRTGLANRLGNREEDILARLTDRGVDMSGVDIEDFADRIDPTTTNNAVSRISRMAARRSQNRGGNFDRARNRSRVMLGNDISNANDAYTLAQGEEKFNTEFEPVYQDAQARLADMANTSAISADKEAALRAQIAARFKTAAAGNLSRVGSALGLRGMSDSPAAAALASSMAMDYDTEAIKTLRDFGLQVADTNRDQLRRDLAASTGLANLRMVAEKAYLSDDRAAVNQIGRETAALIDSLYARDLQWDMMEKQYEDATDESLSDRLGSWISIANSLIRPNSSPGQSPSRSAPTMPSEYDASYGTEASPDMGFDPSMLAFG
jgi:hypothetical protein